MNTALGLIIDAAYQGITGTEHVLEPFGLVLVNPAALHPHTLDGSHVSLHVEFAKSQEADPGLQGLTLSARCRQEASTLT